MMPLSKNSTGVHWMPWEQMGVRHVDPRTRAAWIHPTPQTPPS